MGAKMMMGFMLSFVLLTIMSLIVEGAWMGETENNTVRWLTTFTTAGVSLTTIPIFLKDFFIYGIPSMVSWDYSFLDSSWGSLLRWILFCTISLGFVWTIIQLLYPILAASFNAIGGALTGLVRRF